MSRIQTLEKITEGLEEASSSIFIFATLKFDNMYFEKKSYAKSNRRQNVEVFYYVENGEQVSIDLEEIFPVRKKLKGSLGGK